MNQITRYDPWALLDQLHNEVNRLFDSRLGRLSDENTRVVTSDWIPPVDIKEEQDRFVLLADIPGVDPKEIEITMENGVLSIRGERRIEDDGTFKRVERPRGTFYRRFSLPDTADPDRISARGRNGVLEIVIPKAQKAQPRRITVES